MGALPAAAAEVMRWSFQSHAQLAQAGFRFRTEVACGRCGVRVLIYVAPKGYSMALERGTFAPHRDRCSGAKSKTPAGQANLFGVE